MKLSEWQGGEVKRRGIVKMCDEEGYNGIFAGNFTINNILHAEKRASITL